MLPGRLKREDVFALTSNTDILPTILNTAKKDIPSEIEGICLPGFGSQEDKDRPIFSVYSVKNSSFAKLTKAVIAMRKRNYKLIAYIGSDNVGHDFELYDLVNDPDELHDLANKDVKTLNALKNEYLEYLHKANEPFK